MRPRDAWSQDVVLKAMCDGIARRRKNGLVPDFIHATGDLAFSGNDAEYKTGRKIPRRNQRHIGRAEGTHLLHTGQP